MAHIKKHSWNWSFLPCSRPRGKLQQAGEEAVAALRGHDHRLHHQRRAHEVLQTVPAVHHRSRPLLLVQPDAEFTGMGQKHLYQR